MSNLQFTIKMRHPEFGEMETLPTPKIVNIKNAKNVNSALNPLLWLIGIFLLFFFVVLFHRLEFWITAVLLIFLFLILITILGCFIYFMLKKPDYLRSESYQIQKINMESLGEKNKETSPLIIEAQSESTKPLASKR